MPYLTHSNKVDDFDFEVVNFPFPDSNIHSETGYNAFYSQLVRFFRLCNNINDFCVRVYMIRSKLSARGYKEKLMHKFFLKFGKIYPVLLKYSIPDIESLWSATFRSNVDFCNVSDRGAVLNLTKPSKIMLIDIDYDRQPKSSELSNPVNVKSSDPVYDIENTNFDTTQSVSPITQPPCGLRNPRNHCYINSVLQIFVKILSPIKNQIKFNRNEDGELTKYFFDCLQDISSKQLGFFKEVLAGYDRFFDGILQRDALECFLKFSEFLHSGTKACLIDCEDGSLIDDDFVTSLTKILFTSTLKKSLICSVCQFNNESDVHTQLVNVYPENKKYISDLLNKSLLSQITKLCVVCSINTLHYEHNSLISHPNYLIIVVNRFTFNTQARKDKTSVIINRKFKHNSIDYDLVGTILHHGDSLNSGHYTSKIYYTDAAFHCNDERITKEGLNEETSSEIYIAFYKSSV